MSNEMILKAFEVAVRIAIAEVGMEGLKKMSFFVGNVVASVEMVDENPLPLAA